MQPIFINSYIRYQYPFNKGQSQTKWDTSPTEQCWTLKYEKKALFNDDLTSFINIVLDNQQLLSV